MQIKDIYNHYRYLKTRLANNHVGVKYANGAIIIAYSSKFCGFTAESKSIGVNIELATVVGSYNK